MRRKAHPAVDVATRLMKTFADYPDERRVLVIRGKLSNRLYVLPERVASMVGGEQVGWYTRDVRFSDLLRDLGADDA